MTWIQKLCVLGAMAVTFGQAALAYPPTAGEKEGECRACIRQGTGNEQRACMTCWQTCTQRYAQEKDGVAEICEKECGTPRGSCTRCLKECAKKPLKRRKTCLAGCGFRECDNVCEWYRYNDQYGQELCKDKWWGIKGGTNVAQQISETRSCKEATSCKRSD
ncbi:MAG: hypothetical protein M1549_01125 [Candidatus Dependentiae bacterium]|nr:hypothetical protein [Candidatus Dependentiae bacterium]